MPQDYYVGVNPNNPDSLTDPERKQPDTTEPEGGEAKTYGQPAGQGPWLEEQDEAKVAKQIVKAWTDQDRSYSRYWADVLVNERRRQGYANVRVDRDTDRDLMTVWSWGGAQATLMNTAARLCRRFTSALLADPPEPDPQPNGSDAKHADQAKFAGKVLTHLLGEAELDATYALRAALDRACISRRAYISLWVDPNGERVPIQIEAHPMALTADQPLQGPPQMDPVTGMPLPATPLPASEAILRYVAEDGRLTDTRAEAAWGWAPKLRRELLDGRQVRYLPATAHDLWEAHGALVASWTPVKTLKAMLPSLAEATPEDWKAWKDGPTKARMLLPGETKAEKEAAANLEGDEQMIFTVRAWYTSCAAYPQGFYGVALGNGVKLAHRQEWMADMPDVGPEALDIPLTEIVQWPDEGVMDIVGPGNEIRASQLAAILEQTDRAQDGRIFLPHGSMVSPQDALDRSKAVLFFNPAGKPEFEKIEPLDPSVWQLYESTKEEMQEDLGLGETAENLSSSNVTSGRQAFAIVGQAHVNVSEPLQNLERGYVRLCRVVLQLARAFYTVPQRLSWVAPDGAYLEKRWVGADLGSTRDIKLKAGTLSMLTPPQKVEQALSLSQSGVPITPEELREIVADGIGPIMGLKDDPQRSRIRRQMYEWEQGPPEGWQPLPPIVAGVDAMGQPVMQPAPDPALSMWEPVPSDVLPEVAMARSQELSRGMAGEGYSRWPKEWRASFDAEFERMRQAAGRATIAEQQAAAAQQVATQQANKLAEKQAGRPPQTPERVQNETRGAVVSANGIGA